MTDQEIDYPRASFYPRKDRGGEYWVDFSAWKPVKGARRGPLYIDGGRTKTTSKSRAAETFTELHQKMKARWRRHIGADAAIPLQDSAELGRNPMVRDVALKLHFPRKKGKVQDSSLHREIRALKVFLRHSDPNLRFDAMTPLMLQDYIDRRLDDQNMAPSTVHKELSAVSELSKTAMEHGLLDENPVKLVRWKPKVSREEPEFLQYHDAGELLRAAKEYSATCDRRGTPCLEALLAAMLVQGLRNEEARGLLRKDIDLGRGRFHVRPNRFRGLKRPWHTRSMPLWPQTREALERWLFEPSEDSSGVRRERFGPDDPIFPGTKGGIIQDVRRSFWTVLVAAGLATWKGPDSPKAGIQEGITFHTLRHTYCAARLQTTDRGAPIQQHTVMAEMGHRDYILIATIYGHVQHDAQRGSEVRFEPYPTEDSSNQQDEYRSPEPDGTDPSRERAGEETSFSRKLRDTFG